MCRRICLVAGLSFALSTLSLAILFASDAGAAAVLSQVRGRVTLKPPSGTGVGLPARPLQPLSAGTILRLASRAEAVVLCSGDRVTRLQGPTEWQAGPETCAAGQPLPTGTYARLVLPTGKVRSLDGNLLEEAPSRSGDDPGKLPVLLSPHGPQRGHVLVSEAQPSITWMEVRGALVYRLILRRGQAEEVTAVDASRADCVSDPRSAPVRACKAAWPWSPLAEGVEATLAVEAETDDPNWRVRRADPSRLRLAGATVRRQLEEQLAHLTDTGLPAASEELLRAAVYEEARFFNEAAAALAASLAAEPQASVAVRLGNLYLGLGLLHSAANQLNQAQARLPRPGEDDELRAAVELALGRLHARREDPEGALEFFERAAKTLRRLGEAEAAAEALSEAAHLGGGAR
jgi:hypothetical protein